MISRASFHVAKLVQTKSITYTDRSFLKSKELWQAPWKRYSCNKNSCCGDSNEKKKTGLSYLLCRAKEKTYILSPWYILRKVGFSACTLIKMRRFLLRNSYPWVIYCVPTAVVMMLGDAIAQYYYPRILCNGKRKPYDWFSTLKYGLMGFFIVGPIISKWNYFIMRKLSCMKPYKYLMSRILLDVFILAPLLLGIVMALYDAKYISENLDKTDKLRCKFMTPLKKIMAVNLLTRPIMMMLLCALVPQCIKRHVRGLYEILFFTYVSRILRCHYFGLSTEEIRKIQVEQRKKQLGPEHSGFCETVRKLLGCMCGRQK